MHRAFTWMIGAAAAACCCAALAQAHVDLQAHRGGRGLRPENTIAAFDNAIKMGVSALELDVVATKDGVLIVSHEPALNPDLARGPDGRYVAAPGTPFIALTRAEIEGYDVGRMNPDSKYARAFPDQRPVDGQRVPRLKDVLDLLAASENKTVRLEIEIKGSPLQPQLTPEPARLADMVVDEIQASGLTERADVLSFDWRALQEVQRRAPQIRTVYLTAQLRELDNLQIRSGGDSPWTAGFEYRQYRSVPKMIKAAGGSAWSSFWRELDAQQVSEAHAEGLKVIAWTVNEPAAIARMLDMGVDGIVTDRPDTAMDVFRTRHLSWQGSPKP